MVWAKLETLDELKAICLFHLIGFVLEVFKTSAGIRSWVYPDFAYSKVLGVPLFSGFMYAAVGSYEASGMTRPSGGGCVAPWSRAASCEVILLQAALVHAFLDNRTG